MSEGKILIIDSEEKSSSLIRIILMNRGFDVNIAYNGKQGVDSFSTNRVDIVYLAMTLSDMDPLYMIREFKKRDLNIIIVALIPQDAINLMQEAFSHGVYDYVKKPPQPEEVYFTTRRAMLQRKYLINSSLALNSLEERNISLQRQNIMLAKRIEESTKNLTQLYEDLRDTYMRTIKALAQAIDARDHYTHSHSENVTKYADIMAVEMGLDTQKIEEITDACQLHDLGKIGVHDYILTKAGKLTPEEFEEVKLHALKGAQILEPLTFLEGVIRIVKQHHERYDGQGYPTGLKGEQIDLGARIMAVADTYDAMTSARPYRTTPLAKEEAVAEIKKCSGAQFDPKVVAVFLKVVNRF
ncbi:MAG: HD domain-containing protein [Candidatus Omnitrophica bacterium]|nr:HD domain-containing protein [Candidatus Omnitrophota bacterium]MDD5352742.1 HD domain-containing protein [Candidatus Omnitrophota bacterium]MDD5550341.1 HD domain-containing protein [Candidatus Omnitrophota bacterium]